MAFHGSDSHGGVGVENESRLYGLIVPAVAFDLESTDKFRKLLINEVGSLQQRSLLIAAPTCAHQSRSALRYGARPTTLRPARNSPAALLAAS